MTKIYKCDSCKDTHTCEYRITDNPKYTFSPENDLVPIACPFPYYDDEHDDRKGTWGVVEVNPPIEDQPAPISEPNADADVDALLEVIKQKDAVIDDCRSSIRHYRNENISLRLQIGDLEKAADVDLLQKYTALKRKVEIFFEMSPLWLIVAIFIFAVGAVVGANLVS